MQYAEEIGLPDDPNPQYTCTLCSVSVDAANHHLHFTSAAHRLAVLVRAHVASAEKCHAFLNCTPIVELPTSSIVSRQPEQEA